MRKNKRKKSCSGELSHKETWSHQRTLLLPTCSVVLCDFGFDFYCTISFCLISCDFSNSSLSPFSAPDMWCRVPFVCVFNMVNRINLSGEYVKQQYLFVIAYRLIRNIIFIAIIRAVVVIIVAATNAITTNHDNRSYRFAGLELRSFVGFSERNSTPKCTHTPSP